MQRLIAHFRFVMKLQIDVFFGMALLPRCYTAGKTRENGPFLYPSHQKFATNYSNHPVKFELSKEIHPTRQVGDAKSFNL